MGLLSLRMCVVHLEWQKWNIYFKKLTYYTIMLSKFTVYSQKYWQELSLVVEANIVAIATVLVDWAIRYGMLIQSCK